MNQDVRQSRQTLQIRQIRFQGPRLALEGNSISIIRIIHARNYHG